MADPQMADGYRLTLRCDTCGINERCWFLGRAGVPDDGLKVLIGGWGSEHAGHKQIVLASPASIEVIDPEEEDDGPPEELLRDLVYEAVGVGLSTESISVLTAFATRTGVDGETELAVRELARHMNRSSGTVSRHVTRLEESGFLQRVGRSSSDGRRQRWRVAGMDRREEIPGVVS